MITISENATPLIRSLGRSFSNKQFLMFVEVLPHEFIDVIGKSLQHVTQIRGSVDNSDGFKTINDAIVVTKHVAFRMIPYVEAKNFLFVFSQTIEAANGFLANTPLHYQCPANTAYKFQYFPQNDGKATEKDKRNHYAMIICKVSQTHFVNPWSREKQQKTGQHEYGHAVTWRDLQEFDNRFSPI